MNIYGKDSGGSVTRLNLSVSSGGQAQMGTISGKSLNIITGNATRIAIGSTGSVTISTGPFIVTNPTTPASATATGTVGTIAWDTNFVYVCVATNTWKRAALTTW
jgi:hypothetical protein